MRVAPELTFAALSHSWLFLAGLLLLALGLGDAIVGRSKMEQYETMLRGAPTTAAEAPAALFATATEGGERRTLALAKVSFYRLLFTAGQLLSAIGFVLMALGVLQIRVNGPRISPPLGSSD